MSPIEIILVVVCVMLLALATVVTVLSRRLASRLVTMQTAVERLTERVEELARRESAREAAEAARHIAGTDVDPADWVITFDDREPTTASPERVAGVALGEPLIKIAAFSHGVRLALREETRAHLAYQVRRDYRLRRRATRSRARAAR